MDELPRVICVVGPTGTGKSAAALHLAERLGGEIINADSRQVYADFPLITAQPSPGERAVRPHHLYGFLETECKINAGAWAARARRLLDEVCARGALPVVVGGTGLYIQALTEGAAQIPPVPAETAQRLEAEYARDGFAALHARLREVDPAYAARTHAHNRQRVLRALGVWESTGRSFSEWHARERPRPLCRAICFALDTTLERLTPRLHARIAAMLEAGALDEARRALERCGDGAAPGWSGIGCAELYRHLAGELSLERAGALWAAHTRAYAKRQLTWFRGRPGLIWTDAGDFSGMTEAARRFTGRSG